MLSTIFTAAMMTLTPVGPWQVDFGDVQCRLLHEFDVSGTKALFALSGAGPSPVAGSDYYRIHLVFGPDGPKPRQAVGTARITFDGNDKEQRRPYASGVTTKGDGYLYFVAEFTQLSSLSQIRHLHVQAAQLDVDLQLGATPKVMATLKACMDDLQTQWGLDPSERDRISVPARPLVKIELLSQDFEISNLKPSTIGAFILTWTIDIDGRAKDCQVKVSSGSPRLDQATCKTIETQARYSPALDKTGKPMAVHFFARLGSLAT